MLDYESIYVQIMHQLRDSGVCESMSDAAIQAEQITEIVKENVEEELSNGTE